MNMIRTFTIVGIYLFSFTIFGCASFKISAPEGPVKPMSTPVVENSTIILPVILSLKSSANNINKMLSINKDRNKSDRQSNVLGKLQDLLDKQASNIDADLINNMYLRLAIGKAWAALQSPIRLNYGLSLLLNPQAVQVSPPAGQNDSVKIVAVLIARPKLVTGDLPIINTQPLPNVSIAPALPENGFHIALDNELSFDFISNELTKRLEGKAYPVDGNNVIIEKVRIYGSGDSVIMEVGIKGTVKGAIYLIGIPVYDESTRYLYVRNLDYTLETKHILVKAADWLLHSRLRDGLADQAKWFIGDKLDTVKDLLSDALNRKVNQQVSVSGKIHIVRPVAVGITNTSLKAVLIADGTVEVTVF